MDPITLDDTGDTGHAPAEVVARLESALDATPAAAAWREQAAADGFRGLDDL